MGTMKQAFGVFTILILLAVTFQNCSEFVARQIASEEGIQSQSDKGVLSRLFSSEELVAASNLSAVSKALPNVFFGQEFSVVALVSLDKVSQLSIYGGSLDTESSDLIWDGSFFYLKHTSDATNYSQVKVARPTGTQKWAIVAIRFSNKPETIKFMLNGVNLQVGTPVFAGFPVNYGYAAKQIKSSEIQEFYVFNRLLETYELNTLSRFIAQNYGLPPLPVDNTTEPTPEEPPTEKFLMAQTVLQNNCFSCHQWSQYSQKNFISAGLIVAQNKANSKIYYRLNGATEGPGPFTMPPGSALAASDRQIVADWIDSIGTAAP